MEWLFANPWPLAVFFLLVAVGATWYYSQNSSTRALTLKIALFLLVLLPFLLDWLVETPREQVYGYLHRLARAAESGDADTLADAIAENYQNNPRQHVAVTNQVRQQINALELENVSLNGLEIDANAKAATAKFVAMVYGGFRSNPHRQNYPLRLVVNFQKQEKGWRITNVKRLPIVGDISQEIQLFQY